MPPCRSLIGPLVVPLVVPPGALLRDASVPFSAFPFCISMPSGSQHTHEISLVLAARLPLRPGQVENGVGKGIGATKINSLAKMGDPSLPMGHEELMARLPAQVVADGQVRSVGGSVEGSEVT